MFLRRLMVPVFAVAVAACGGDAKKPAASAADGSSDVDTDDGMGEPASDEGDEGEEEVETSNKGLPTDCAEQIGDICLPPKKFVKYLCDGDYRTVALAMFSSGTVWTRGYLTRPIKEAWSASAGSSPVKMAKDEEVLVLKHRKPPGPGGMQVSGTSGGYEAMRWDAMCITLDAGDLRFDAPGKINNARIIWSTLEPETRDVLKKDENVRPVYLRYRKECKGVTVGDVTKKCEKVDAELSRTIAAHVRDNGGLPTPNKLPKSGGQR